MKTYTIEQFRKYLDKQDSFGDIFYNLSEENIDQANILLGSDEDSEEMNESNEDLLDEAFDGRDFDYSYETPSQKEFGMTDWRETQID